LHPQVNVKLDVSIIKIHSIQIDPSGLFVPLVVLDSIHPISSDHLEYSMKWSSAGEKLAKIVIKIIKDKLE
jgi:hypothetical protein